MKSKHRILLVRVPEIDYGASQTADLRTVTLGSLTVPLGIPYITSSIRQKNLGDIEVLDLWALHYLEITKHHRQNPQHSLEICLQSLSQTIEDVRPDIVGFSALFLFQHHLVKELAMYVKQAYPNLKIFLGGYCTLVPELVMKDIPALDIAFIGEAEKTIIDVLESGMSNENLRKISGIAFRDGSSIEVHKGLNAIARPDEIAPPAFDVLPLDLYRKILGRMELPLLTSRSCPFACSFCSSHVYSGRALRLRSREILIEDLKHMKADHGLDFLWIRDENFILNKDHSKGLLRDLLKSKLDVPWCDSNGFHVNSIDKELLDLCKETKCTSVIFAIESGSQRVLRDIMKKRVDLEHAKEMADHCHKIDLSVQAYFVIGNPGETKEEIQRTIDYAVEIGVDHCTFSIATPFPGTRYWQVALEKGYLLNDPDYILQMKYQDVNLGTEEFSAEWLKNTQYDANIRVNFLENRTLSAGRGIQEEALKKYARISDQYSSHAVSRVINGYLLGQLEKPEESYAVFSKVEELLQDKNINDAYGKYFDWNTPATNAFREWQNKAKA